MKRKSFLKTIAASFASLLLPAVATPSVPALPPRILKVGHFRQGEGLSGTLVLLTNGEFNWDRYPNADWVFQVGDGTAAICCNSDGSLRLIGGYTPAELEEISRQHYTPA